MHHDILLEGHSVQDPIWESAFVKLAKDLLELGAKSKIIVRYTGLDQRTVTALSRAMLNRTPTGGPLEQTKAKIFLKTSLNFNLQSALFANAYLRLQTLLPANVSRGYLLVQAFHAYKAMTDHCVSVCNRRLNINQAYNLVAHIGAGKLPNAELRVVRCDECSVSYLAQSIHDDDCCPACSLNEHRSTIAAKGVVGLVQARAAAI